MYVFLLTEWEEESAVHNEIEQLLQILETFSLHWLKSNEA